MESIKITREEFKMKAALVGTEGPYLSGEKDKGLPYAIVATSIAAQLFAELEIVLFGFPEETEEHPRRRGWYRDGVGTR